jgi:AAA15 family ATPase/GTPase
MLLELTIGNYRSFREDQTLSLVSTKLKSRDPAFDTRTRHTLSEDVHILHSAAIYGANASGKSNLVRALHFVLGFVKNSAREGQAGDRIQVDPFLFHEDSRNEPSYFEVVFRHENVQYRYGFEVDREKVHREWLYRTRKKETLLLKREGQSFELHGELKEEQEYASGVRPNALFLSVAAQLNRALAIHLLEWFQNKIAILTGLHDVTHEYTARCIRDEVFGDRIKKLILSFDVGIANFSVDERKVTRTDLPDELPEDLAKVLVGHARLLVKSAHDVYDNDGTKTRETAVAFEEESEGTQKLFALAGPIIESLATGSVLVIDEFDARLHPLVSRQIVELFHDPTTNPHHAQLILATHDTNLLSKDIFRRDQIWFVEKSQKGESSLYSLASFQVRNDASFESDYFRGRYGAVPFLGGLRRVLASPDSDGTEHQSEALS